MINKNIKKILNLNQIAKLSNLDLYSRPSEISPEITIKLLNYLRKDNFFFLT